MDTIRGLVRPVVTFAAIAVFAYLAMVDLHVREEFVITAVSIISYWFGQRNEQKSP